MAMNTDAMLNMLNDINLSALNDPGMFQELEVFAKELMNSSNPAHRFAALKINNRLQENPYYQNYLKTELIQKEEIKANTDKRFENAYQAHRENASIANVQNRRQEERKEREDFEKSISLQNLSLKDQLIKIEYVMKEMYGNMTGEQQVEFLNNVNEQIDKYNKEGNFEKAQQVAATTIFENENSYKNLINNPNDPEIRKKATYDAAMMANKANGQEAINQTLEVANKLNEPVKSVALDGVTIGFYANEKYGIKFKNRDDLEKWFENLSKKEREEFERYKEEKLKKYLENENVVKNLTGERFEYIQNRLQQIHSNNSYVKKEAERTEDLLKSVLDEKESPAYTNVSFLRDKINNSSNYLINNFISLVEESGVHQNPKTMQEIKENNQKIEALMHFQGEEFIKTLTINSDGIYNSNLQEFFHVQITQMLNGQDPRLLRSDPVFKELFDLNKTIDPDNLILKNIIKGLWFSEEEANKIVELLKQEYKNKTEEEINLMIQKDREELSKVQYKDVLEEKRLFQAYGEYYYKELKPESGKYIDIQNIAREQGYQKAIEFVKSQPNFNQDEMQKFLDKKELSEEKIKKVENKYKIDNLEENNDNLFANLKTTPQEDVDKVTQNKNLSSTVENHPNQAEVFEPNKEKDEKQIEQQANIAIIQSNGASNI